MIVVAMIGILAGILVLSFNKPANKVKTGSEVAAMFAEFHRAQSQYALENGTYFSTGTSDSDVFPASPGKTAQDVTSPPDEWSTLRIQPSAQKLYCGYVAVAGTVDDDVPGFADDFNMDEPSGNWYALYALCDADGNTAVNATYFSSSIDTTTVKRNEGH